MSTLDFKQTIAFVNLANTLDYQYAAKKSGITVDELVRTIKALENELN
ncbi:transcriptional regulator, partial [Limosilactobacillus reuteri]